MEKICIGENIWLDLLYQKLENNDEERSFKMNHLNNDYDFLMCKKDSYIYLYCEEISKEIRA